jgi:hydroxymethylpyrimidine/phosphomethylpyrimidine kinase
MQHVWRVLRDKNCGKGIKKEELREAMIKTALTIAGSDPTGGAGLQADLKVFRYFNVHGLSVVTSITAQNTKGVDSVFPAEQESFQKQLNVILSDIKPDALKTGMIYNKWMVNIILRSIKEYSLKNLVIDPVSVSSSGKSLMEEGTLDEIKDKLFPLSKIITPNIYEASILTGMIIEDTSNMEQAAKALKNMGPEIVVITGGHLNDIALDLYYDGEFHKIESEKLKGEYHGTGCAFSAALTALLALDYAPLKAVKKAKEFIKEAIKQSFNIGKGMSLLKL